MPRLEYRVIWKREGLNPKRKRYANKPSAERFMRLFGPEPWRVWAPKKGPDDLVCCPGTQEYECACMGVTMQQEADHRAAELPKVEWMRLECRDVGNWEPYHLSERPAPPEATECPTNRQDGAVEPTTQVLEAE